MRPGSGGRFTHDADSAIEIAGRNAEATARLATVTEQSVRNTQRAQMALLKFNPGAHIDNGQVVGLFVEAVWKNVGPTAALNVEMYCNFVVADPHVVPEFPIEHREDDQQGTIGGQMERIAPPVSIPIDVLFQAWQGEKRILVYTLTEYDDVFEDTPRRVSKYCFEPVLPASPEWLGTQRQYIVNFRTWGPFNEAT